MYCYPAFLGWKCSGTNLGGVVLLKTKGVLTGGVT